MNTLKSIGYLLIISLILGNNAFAGLSGVDSPKHQTSKMSETPKAYTLRCWQEGKQIISETGVGRLAINESFIKSSVSMFQSIGDKAHIRVFSMGYSICQLEISPG